MNHPNCTRNTPMCIYEKEPNKINNRRFPTNIGLQITLDYLALIGLLYATFYILYIMCNVHSLEMCLCICVIIIIAIATKYAHKNKHIFI